MNFKDFFLLDKRDQFLHFNAFRIEVKSLVVKCLWTEFRRKNNVLVEECVSIVLEKLVIHQSKIDREKARSFVYSVAKRYFQEWFFEKSKNANTIFLEELPTDDQKLDTTNHLLFEDRNNDNELEELKTDVVLRFHDLIRNLNDTNSLLLISALIECVLTQENYNSQMLSLFLYRKTKLGFDALYRAVRKLNLTLSISRPEYFESSFENYKKIEPPTGSTDNKIITDWEKRALFHFESCHERFRGVNYDARHNRCQEKPKVKSTPHERILWIRSNPKNQNLEKEYYERFGKAYRTFKSDRKAAYN
jgi:hypothetical protein